GRDLVALHEALETLAKHDERKSRVIEMRFFGGLTVEETAEALDVSPDTVKRDWKLAKAWLLRELRQENSILSIRIHDVERPLAQARTALSRGARTPA